MNTTTAIPEAQPVRKTTVMWAQRVRPFLRWWKQELLAALPPALRQRLLSEDAPPLVALAGAQTQLLIAGDTGALSIISMPAELTEVAPLAWVAQELARRDKPPRIALAVGVDGFVQRNITLPAAAEEGLDAVLGFELDRHTPFKMSQARYRGRVVSRSADGSTLNVRLVASPLAHLSTLAAQARNAGFDLAGAFPHPEAAGEGWREFNLLDDEASRGPSHSQKGWMVGAGVAFFLLLSAALLIPVWQKREAAIALLPQVGTAKEEAANVQRIRAEVERIANDTNFIRSRKHASVPPVTLIEDLAKSFPDTSWLMVLEMKQGPKQREVVLTGEAAAAAKVVETLEQLPYLSNASFRSPLTKLQGQSAERFVIAAELKPRPIPASVLEQPLPVQASPQQPVASPQPASSPASTTPAPVQPSANPVPPTQAPPSAKDLPQNPTTSAPDKGKGSKP